MKSGTRLIITGVLLSIIGMVVIPVVAVFFFISSESDSSETQFLIPGEKEFTVDEPGRYYLWNDHLTIFEGESYNRAETIPDGIKIRIESSSGEELPFTTSMNLSIGSGSTSKNSIGYVEIETPEKISVQVTDSEEVRVFSFSESGFAGLFLGVIGICLSSGILFIAGMVFGIMGIVKLSNSNTNKTVGGTR